MFEGYTAFPFLRTKRIIINGDRTRVHIPTIYGPRGEVVVEAHDQELDRDASVKIECLLSSSILEDTLQPSWFKIREFAEFVKFYFILVDDGLFPSGADDFVGMMTDPSSRANLARINFHRENSRQTPWDVFLNNRSGVKKISLADILLQNDNINTSATDLTLSESSLSFEVEITGVSLANYRIAFSESSADRTSPPSQKLSLIAFSHLDVAALQVAFNLGQTGTAALDNLSKIGGNMTYDTLMVYDIDSGRHVVPRTRSVLFHSQLGPRAGERFFGPARYYRVEDEEPSVHRRSADPNQSNFYVGWKSVIGNFELDAIMQNNEKVYAPILLEDQAFVSGYFGANAIYDVEDGDLGAHTLSAGAEDPLRSLRLKTNYFMEMRTEDFHRRLREHVLKYYKKNSLEIIIDQEEWIAHATESDRSGDYSEFLGTSYYNPIVPRSGFGTADASAGYHNIFFGINYVKAIRTNSRLGYLMNSVTPADYTSILNRSEILNMTISRRRITNEPYGHNPMGTNAYKYHDLSEYDKFIVRARDVSSPNNWSGTLQDGLNPGVAIIKEMPVVYDGFEETSRSFWIKDFDLFKNVNFGNYTYILELEIKDGIQDYVLEEAATFRSQLEEYRKFLVAASVPALAPSADRYYGAGKWQASIYGLPVREPGSSSVNDPDGSGSAIGSYDYVNREYTMSFKAESALNWAPKIKSLIRYYYRLVNMLSRDHSNLDAAERWDLIQEMENFILPSEAGTLEMAEMFYEKCTKLLGMYEQILQRGKHNYDPTLPATGQFPIDWGKFREETISIRVDLKFVIEAVKEGTIVRSYGIPPLFDSLAALGRISNIFVGPRLWPEGPESTGPEGWQRDEDPMAGRLGPQGESSFGQNTNAGSAPFGVSVFRDAPMWNNVTKTRRGSRALTKIRPVAYSRHEAGQNIEIVGAETQERMPQATKSRIFHSIVAVNRSQGTYATNYGPGTDWVSQYNDGLYGYATQLGGTSMGILGVNVGFANGRSDENLEPEEAVSTVRAQEIEGVLCESLLLRNPYDVYVENENLRWIESHAELGGLHELALNVVEAAQTVPEEVHFEEVVNGPPDNPPGPPPIDELAPNLKRGFETMESALFDDQAGPLIMKAGPSRAGADFMGGSIPLMGGGHARPFAPSTGGRNATPDFGGGPSPRNSSSGKAYRIVRVGSPTRQSAGGSAASASQEHGRDADNVAFVPVNPGAGGDW